MSIEKTIWDFFKARGLNDYGIAGLMGNLFAESGLRANNMQNSYEKKIGYTDQSYTEAVDSGKYSNFVKDSVGYGLAQWTYWSRKQNLLNYARSVGKSIGDEMMQLEFLYQELKNNYKSVWNKLRTAESVLEASNCVLMDFERPANQSVSVQSQRAQYGMGYYNQFATRSKRMRINLHAGHNPDGKIACGAIGFIKESTEARRLKEKVMDGWRKKGYTVYDCTVDDGNSASDVLRKIVSKCNSNEVDLDVSIHFNAGSKGIIKNNKTTGVECLVYSKTSKSVPYAASFLEAISNLGFKNRGIKVRTDLYYLRKTKAPAVLIEVCFVDDRDDCELYNVNKVAEALINSI